MSVPHERRTRSRVFGFSILGACFAVIAVLWGCATPLLVAGATGAAISGGVLHNRSQSEAERRACGDGGQSCDTRGASAEDKKLDGLIGYFEGRREARVYEAASASSGSDSLARSSRAPVRSTTVASATPAPQPTRVAAVQTGIATDLYDLGQPYAVFDRSGFVGVRVIPNPVRKP